MSSNMISNDQKQGLQITLETSQKLDWVVRENPKLQAELNGLLKNSKELSPKVVNKVVDRIKSL